MKHITGTEAFNAVITSPNYPGHMVTAKAEQMIKVFLPPVEEYMSLMATPLPKPRQEWLNEYKTAQRAYFNTVLESE